MNSFFTNSECEDIAILVSTMLPNALSGEDEDNKELAADLLNAAIKYAKYRMDWAIHDSTWKIENDKYRTSAHNRFMDCLNIFLRYNKHCTLEKYDRKDLGDIACYLAYAAAISERS